MKHRFVFLLALFALSAQADGVGNASLLLSGGYAPGFSQFEVNDLGDKLVGVSGTQVYLEKQNGGYKGFAFNRPFNLTCNGDRCIDNGSTQADLTVKYASGGFLLDGTLNFVQVHAVVNDQSISLSTMGFSTNMSFELERNRDGTFSGEGAYRDFNSFTATLSASGSLQGFKDPATFVVLVVNPFVRN